MLISLTNSTRSFMVLSALFVLSALSFSLPVTSSATLISELDGQLALDDLTGKVWVTNLLQFTNQTYSQQIEALNDLNFPGYSGFHLAGVSEAMYLLASYFINPQLLDAQFTPTTTSPYVSLYGRTSTPMDIDQNGNPISHYYGSAMAVPPGLQEILDNKAVGDGLQASWLGAWVYGVPTPVPEPCTFILFGTGMSGLAIKLLRKRKKLKKELRKT